MKKSEIEIPTNHMLEKIVLGLVLKGNSASEYVVQCIPTDAFENPHHRLVFASCKELHHSGESTYVEDVRLILSSTGKIDKAGGEKYLNDLYQNASGGLAYKTYCQQFLELHRQKLIIKLLHSSLTSKIPFGESLDFLSEIEEKISLIKNFGESLGHETFEGLLSGENPSMDSKTLREYLEERRRKFLNLAPGEKLLEGYSTGFDHLDEITMGLVKGSINIFAARPGMGFPH